MRPEASRSGPPDEPGASGAVCSRLPAIRRPRGPRKARAVAETVPSVTRTSPELVAAAPKTTAPGASASASPQAGPDPDHRRPGDLRHLPDRPFELCDHAHLVHSFSCGVTCNRQSTTKTA